MTFRTRRERTIQTVAYEAGGLLLAAPAYAWWWGERSGTSVLMLVALSIAVLIWAPLHNTVFDRIDWRMKGRTASARSVAGRVCMQLRWKARC